MKESRKNDWEEEGREKVGESRAEAKLKWLVMGHLL